MASNQAMSIDALPPELLRLIFGVLDGPAPSDGRLVEQPDADMLRDPNCPLKNISLVSKRWRAVALPVLFRKVFWAFEHCSSLVDGPAEHLDVGSSVPVDDIAILAFLRANDLGRHVCSFTIIVRRAAVEAPTPTDWQTSLVRNPILEAHAQHAPPVSSAMVYNVDTNWLWDMLFSVMDPLRFTIIASAQVLARLLSCMVFVGNADFFSNGERLHILSLSRNSRSTTAAPPEPSQPQTSTQATHFTPTPHSCPGERKLRPSALFTIRPWTHLLLNENSSIPVYKNYHYFDLRPPSILTSLLGCEEAPNNVPMVPPTVTSLSYIAIFPLVSQFRILVEHLPRLEHLYVQLVPLNDIMLDPKEMDHVQASDLWLERTTCYAPLLGILQSMKKPDRGRLAFLDQGSGADDDGEDAEDGEGGDNTQAQDGGVSNQGQDPRANWKYLKVFETGDAAAEDWWWDSSVQLLQLSNSEWHAPRRGTFVKGPVPDEESDGSSLPRLGSDEAWVGEQPAALAFAPWIVSQF